MGKIFSLIHISLDGYMADIHGNSSWVIMDEEISNYVTEIRQQAEGTLYGRTTYQIMESYWPKVPGNMSPPGWQQEYAEWVNKSLKVLVSNTLTTKS